MISRNFNGFTWKQFIVLLVVLYIGLCVFNYTNAQKSGETSNASTLVSDIVPDYSGIFDNGETSQNYLKNGDFYSQNKPRKLVIDTSYIDRLQAAIWWYDKVIAEFPGTEEANIAFRSKIRTLIGWEEGIGKNKNFFGLHNRFGGKHFILVERTFANLEEWFPNDGHLEALAFQIAQSYFYHIVVYGHKQYNDEYVKWLKKTIEFANGHDTFYSHLAQLRLSLVETVKPKHDALTR